MKEFKLDDWFPVKEIETQSENISIKNFLARLVIKYKATRKLEYNPLFTGKIPRTKIFENMAKNLYGKMKMLNNIID